MNKFLSFLLLGCWLTIEFFSFHKQLSAQNSLVIKPEEVDNRLNSSVISFNLHFLENYVFLGNVRIFQGVLSTSIQSYLPDEYTLKVTTTNNEVIYRQNFRNPQIIFHDSYDAENHTLNGGFVQNSYGIINLKIPYLEKANLLSIYSPESEKIFEVSVRELLSKNDHLTNEQEVKTETLIYNGNPDNRIDLLFMGDGYILEDSTLFRNDVISFINHLFGTSPYNEYYNFFNIHLVYVISQERGADHPELQPPVYRNTALNATYNCDNIPRLICANLDTIYNIAQTTFPYYDKIIVLINDPVYGGSGGTISISYNGSWGRWVFNHEFGHSFGYLLDEYLYANQPGTVNGCNCDNNSTTPKWHPWITIGSPGVGAFPGCSWSNYFRPTNNQCTMNTLQNSFCVVCGEQLAKSINVNVQLYEDYFPANNPTLAIGDTQLFYIEPLQPMNHTVRTHWYINNVRQPGAASDSFYYTPSSTGNYRVMAVIFDSTYLVINDPDYLMVDAVEWQLTVVPSTSLAEDEMESNSFGFILHPNYPNPFNSVTRIEYQLPVRSQVTLTVYDVRGNPVKRLVNEWQVAGLHTLRWDGTSENGQPLASGIYFYVLSIEKEYRLVRKMTILK